MCVDHFGLQAVDKLSSCPHAYDILMATLGRYENIFPQVADIQSRAGKVQGRVVDLQEKVQKHNPKKEKLRKLVNNSFGISIYS